MRPGELERLKRRAAGASLLTNLVLTILKVTAAALTGSVSLSSEAVHSATDVVASAIVYVLVRVAAAPPDDEHPYGHGKIESLAGFGESILLFLIVGYIVIGAGPRFIHPQPMRFAEGGIVLMIFSAIMSVAVGWYVARIGRLTESVALRSNGRHLEVDFWTSTGVLIALLVTRYTGWKPADPVAGCILAAWIALNAYRTLREAVEQLIDRRISDDELLSIEQILGQEPRLLSWHRLRSRHSGSVHFVELHAVVPRAWSVVQAHELADDLETKIETALSPAHVVIHVDPYDPSKVT